MIAAQRLAGWTMRLRLRASGRSAAWGRLHAVWLAESERLALWLPVLFGCGIGVYFWLPVEPPAWIGAAVAATALTVAISSGRTPGIALAAAVLVAAGAGMAVAQLRVAVVTQPVLGERYGPREITARVVSVEARADDGRRIVLDQLAMPGLDPARTPRQIRLRVRPGQGEAAPGEQVTVRAVVLPPPGPAAPDAYDFQRQAFFDQLGGVGYATGPLRRIGEAPAGGSWRLWLNSLRGAVHARIMEAIPGPAGAVAAALVTGEMGAIPDDVAGWMRDSGLAHILSISGLHIGLVAGIVFLAVRGGLALVPPLALRWPIKKLAAVAAFVAISFYTLFAAASPPTLRSWLMTSIVLFAILIDRTAISMRLVAWAAFAVMLLVPESLMGPSFQMSFAAVIALIAAYEVVRDRLAAWRAGRGLVARGAVALVAVCFTTLVAGTASAPYALYHFNRFAAFGLAANLLAIPLTALWVMPCLVFGVLLLPFGSDWAWAPMGWGVEGVIAVARTVAAWDGAVTLLPEMPVWGLVTVTAGGLWLCLWRMSWRLFGVPVIALGLASIALHRGPDVLVSGDARLVAVRGLDGLLQLSDGKASRLTRETWLRRAGQEDGPIWPASGPTADGTLACDRDGCIYTRRGHRVALARTARAVAEDCRSASIVIAVVPIRRGCASASATIDRFDLWRDGGHAVWLEADSRWRIESVRAARGDRPWVIPLPRPRERAPADVARSPSGRE